MKFKESAFVDNFIASKRKKQYFFVLAKQKCSINEK
jgi:hypothetical protein